jgi:hypothetical protein
MRPAGKLLNATKLYATINHEAEFVVLWEQEKVLQSGKQQDKDKWEVQVGERLLYIGRGASYLECQMARKYYFPAMNKKSRFLLREVQVQAIAA